MARLLASRRRRAAQRQQHRTILRPKQRRQHGAAFVAGDDATYFRSGVYQPLQRLSRGPDDWFGRARLQLWSSDGCSGRSCKADAATGNWLRLVRSFVSGEAGIGNNNEGLRSVAGVCVPDFGGALRELVATVLGSADDTDRDLWRVSRHLAARL